VLSGMTSEITGLWSSEYTPHMIEPMRNLSAPGPCEEWIEACTQSGKSTVGQIFLGYTVEEDPSPMSVVMPGEKDANRRVRTKIRTMFDANPALLRHVGGSSKNINIGTETVLDNMILYLAWAGSAVALADNSICKIILDEVGKFPASVGKEADPVSLSRDRQRWFRLRAKLLGISSPVVDGDIFDREVKSGDRRRRWLKCPHCQRPHKVAWSNVIIDRDPDNDNRFYHPDVYDRGGFARYVCPKCHAPWSEIDRAIACSEGNAIWVPDCCSLSDSGRLVGIEPVTNRHSRRVPAMLLHPRIQTMGGLAAEWVRAEHAKQNGDIKPLQNFINSQLAEPFKQVGKIVVIEKLREKKNDRPAREVPDNCVLLTAAADYHEDEQGNVTIDYEVKAFAPKLMSYVILVGAADSWQSFENEVLMTDFGKLAVVTIFVDSGFFPDKVYQWCRRFPGIAWPIKGSKDRQRTPFLLSDLDKVLHRAMRRSRRKYASMYRGMQLVNVDVNYFKDIVTNAAEISRGEPGSMEFYRDIPPYYFIEFANEHKVKVKKGAHEVFVWQPKTERAPTHSLDLNVYSTAAAYFNKIQFLPDPDEAPRVPAAVEQQRRKQAAVQRPVRKNRGGGFLDDMPSLN